MRAVRKPVTIQPFPSVKKGRGQRRNRRNRRRGAAAVDAFIASARLFVERQKNRPVSTRRFEAVEMSPGRVTLL